MGLDFKFVHPSADAERLAQTVTDAIEQHMHGKEDNFDSAQEVIATISRVIGTLIGSCGIDLAMPLTAMAAHNMANSTAEVLNAIAHEKEDDCGNPACPIHGKARMN